MLQVAKTEAHLQATLRPGSENEETLRALPDEGTRGKRVLDDVSVLLLLLLLLLL